MTAWGEGALTAPILDADARDHADEVARLCRFAGLAWFGILVVAVTFGGLGAWSALAPLPKGALGRGFITVESISKTIEHLEGGIVRSIEVSEGDLVEAGEILVRLDQTQARAALARHRDQLRAVRARQAYLRAIRDRLETPPYDGWLLAHAKDPHALSRMIAQHTIEAAASSSITPLTIGSACRNRPSIERLCAPATGAAAPSASCMGGSTS